MAHVDPSVVLLSPLPEHYPLELLYTLWLQSRTETPVVPVEDIQLALAHDMYYEDTPELFIDPQPGISFRAYYNSQIDLILSIDIPLLESLVFVFVVEGMTISMREQLVRHREGSYWLQSGRIRDQRTFASRGAYRTPQGIRGNQELEGMWVRSMTTVQKMFNALLNYGMTIEEARDILPAAQTHRGSVTMNYRALKKMIGRRTSFIAQSTNWHPLLFGLADAVNALDPRLISHLFEPPEIHNGTYIGQTNELENRRRLAGDDPLPPCPIFMKYEVSQYWDFKHDPYIFMKEHRGDVENPFLEYIEYAAQYVKLWGEQTFLDHCWYGELIVKHAQGRVT